MARTKPRASALLRSVRMPGSPPDNVTVTPARRLCATATSASMSHPGGVRTPSPVRRGRSVHRSTIETQHANVDAVEYSRVAVRALRRRSCSARPRRRTGRGARLASRAVRVWLGHRRTHTQTALVADRHRVPPARLEDDQRRRARPSMWRRWRAPSRRYSSSTAPTTTNRRPLSRGCRLTAAIAAARGPLASTAPRPWTTSPSRRTLI